MSSQKTMTRREFIAKTGSACAGLALSGIIAPSAEAFSTAERADRPSILFLIGDDWGWPHAGAYGDKVARTTAFDRLAAEGALLTHAFCASPTCTASRAAILTGQAPHRLEDAANLHGKLDSKFKCYPDIVEAAGYFVGYTGKGWDPGWQPDPAKNGGRTRNPAGPRFPNFGEFLEKLPEGRPFCFWFGSANPHRPYEKGSGVKAGYKLEDVKVPPYLPDTPEVRSDILDYYLEVEQFNKQVDELLTLLAKAGLSSNTIVVMTGDNGWPFPRAKTNLYDAGTRQPLAIRWPERIRPGRKFDHMVSLTDMAPTFLEAAGLRPLAEMTGRSLLGLLTTGRGEKREEVFTERERHTACRPGYLGYPVRAIRTRKYLLIRNFAPERWPAGDPEEFVQSGPFGDVDVSPTKAEMVRLWQNRDAPQQPVLAFGKRPAEELYDVEKDPWQMNNLAGKPEYAKTQKDLRERLMRWMTRTGDPRAVKSDDDRWDRVWYPIRKPEQGRNPSSLGGFVARPANVAQTAYAGIDSEVQLC